MLTHALAPAQVIAVWEELQSRDYSWRGLPRYALGVSSGGAMALVLAQEFALQVGAPCPCSVPGRSTISRFRLPGSMPLLGSLRRPLGSCDACGTLPCTLRCSAL